MVSLGITRILSLFLTFLFHLSPFNLPGENDWIQKENIAYWNYNNTTVIEYTIQDGETNLVIPETIDGLPVEAVVEFAGAESSVKTVKIPKYFQSSSLYFILNKKYSEQFSGFDCILSDFSGLESISVDPENPHFCADENGILYSKDKSVLYKYPAAKTDTSFTVPDGVTRIAADAFSGCTSLNSISFPSTLVQICDGAFEGCTSLKSVSYSKNISRIGLYAFKDTPFLDGIAKEDGVKYWNDIALTANGESISIKDGTRVIADYAFAGEYEPEYNRGSSYVYLPDSVEVIGYCAFYGCEFESIELPSGVTEYIPGIFYKCDNLKNISVRDGNRAFSDDSGVLYNKDKTELLFYPHGKTETSYTALPTTKVIGTAAFEDCRNLTSVYLPEGLEIIGDGAFCGCDRLCDIEVPSTVKIIGDCAFSCCSFTDFELPSSLESIGKDVFYGSSSEVIDTLFIPASVSHIEEDSFFVAPCNAFSVDPENPFYSSDENGVLYNKNKTELICVPGFYSKTAYTVPKAVEKIDSFALFCPYISSVTVLNPNCVMPCFGDLIRSTGNSNGGPNGIEEIRGLSGSTAQAFAEKYGIPFIVITDDGEDCLHSYSDWTVTREATVAFPGERYRTCSLCGYVETEAIFPLNGNCVFASDGTGVRAEFTDGVFDEDVKVNVKLSNDTDAFRVLDGSYDRFTVFDIDIIGKKSEQKLQPDGSVWVGLPIPDGYNPDTCTVVFVDNGQIQELNSVYYNGYMFFEATHFSEYCLVDKASEKDEPTEPTEPDEPENPDNGNKEEKQSFWQRIVSFFNRIIEFFKNLFKR